MSGQIGLNDRYICELWREIIVLMHRINCQKLLIVFKVMDEIDIRFEYLIDCKLSETTDAIRSQYFQLNANKDQFTSQKAFDRERHRLLVRLSAELDKESAKNTYISPTLIQCISNGRSDRSLTDCQSSLYSLTPEKLLATLDIKPKMDSDSDCEVLKVVLKKPEDIKNKTKKRQKDDKKRREKKLKSEENDGSDVPKINPFGTLGSFKNGDFDQKFSEPSSSEVSNAAITSTTSSSNGDSSTVVSPTRVASIRQNAQNSSRSDERDEVQVTYLTKESRSFMSGLEKKCVDDVKYKKNGKDSLAIARKELREIRDNSFRPPLQYNTDKKNGQKESSNEDIDPRLKNIDKHLIETIENEIITRLEPIKREDVAGLEFAKTKIHEIAILPLKKPHLFTGLRKPPKGILLFGPPGTGKTFLGRWIASETKSTFFEITVSTLNSKWIGEGEKTIRAMFAVARARQPSVIFIDEIDSLLKSRCDSEHESSRRMKTEFFTQFEGVSTATDEKLLIIGATNRPQDLDDAARRRLTARLFIGLPDERARTQIIKNCLRPENSVSHDLTAEQILSLAQMTEGYSCADMKLLCTEAAMEGVREMEYNEDFSDSAEQIRNITFKDFEKQLEFVKPSVCSDDLKIFEDWDRQYGTNRR